MSPEDFIKRLENIREKVITAYNNEVNLLAVNEITPVYKNRIFLSGKNTQGGSIGVYAEGQHKKKREKSGRQVAYVDFKFSGSLQKNIQNGVFDNSTVVMGHTDLEEAQIAKGLEDGNGKHLKGFGIIFMPSSAEVDSYHEYMNIYADKFFKKI